MNVIKKPIITEKMTAISEKYNRYGFVVDRKADKLQIKKAVEDLFGVEVLKVNTVSIKGKTRRRGRTEGKTSDYKKAYVELTSDSKTIEFFDNLQ